MNDGIDLSWQGTNDDGGAVCDCDTSAWLQGFDIDLEDEFENESHTSLLKLRM